jgi:hypothetical protein
MGRASREEKPPNDGSIGQRPCRWWHAPGWKRRDNAGESCQVRPPVLAKNGDYILDKNAPEIPHLISGAIAAWIRFVKSTKRGKMEA